MISFLLTYVLVFGILILYYCYKLKDNSINEPYINQNEKEKRKRQSNIMQVGLYIFGIIIPTVYILLDHFDFLSPIFVFITIMFMVISMIFRANKNRKISDILFVIAVLPYIFLLGILEPQKIECVLSDPVNIKQFEVNAVNGRYEPYIGENISGSEVKKLVQQINQNNENEDNKIKVEIESDIVEIKKELYSINKIKNNNKYEVTISEYYDKKSGYNGCIKKIKIYGNK